MKKVLSIDYGQARIGLAISDERQSIAFPLKVVGSGKSIQTTIQNLKKELLSRLSEIEKIVIGLPLLLKGEMSPMAEIVKDFGQKLEKELQIPVIFWDERLSSVQAEQSLKELSFSRKKRKKLVDSVAACIILQCYLDANMNV